MSTSGIIAVIWLLSAVFNLLVMIPLANKVGFLFSDPADSEEDTIVGFLSVLIPPLIFAILLCIILAVAMPTSLPEKYVSVVQKATHR